MGSPVDEVGGNVGLAGSGLPVVSELAPPLEGGGCRRLNCRGSKGEGDGVLGELGGGLGLHGDKGGA